MISAELWLGQELVDDVETVAADGGETGADGGVGRTRIVATRPSLQDAEERTLQWSVDVEELNLAACFLGQLDVVGDFVRSAEPLVDKYACRFSARRLKVTQLALQPVCEHAGLRVH